MFLPEPGSMESAPMIVQDAPAPDNRQAAGSKRHLAACLACALLLACVPTLALLHGSGQMQTFVEAKAGLVSYASWIKVRPPPHTPAEPHAPIFTQQPPPMRTTTHHDAPSTTPDSVTHARWTTIRWAKYPHICLDVAGEHSGAELQIWACSKRFPKKQRFILPPINSQGEIKWATNPNICLDNPAGNVLQWWTCSAIPKRNRFFQVSPDGNGRNRIRLAAQPSKCIDIPSGSSENGCKAQLWDCDHAAGHGHEDNIAFLTHTGVDCAWGSWSTWSACPVTCGGGSHIRSRKVEVNATDGKNSDHIEMGICGSEPCKAGAKVGLTATGLTATTLDPSYNYLTTSRHKVVQRSWTSRARLRIAFMLISFPLAVDPHSIT